MVYWPLQFGPASEAPFDTMPSGAVVSSIPQSPTSSNLYWSYLQTSERPMRMRVLSERSESKDLSASVFNGLRTLSFSVDKRGRPISFRISRLRTLWQNMGGGGTFTFQFFKYYFKRLSGRESRPACPELSRRERAQRVEGSCS